MADNSRDEFDEWTGEEDSGFYGEPNEWFISSEGKDLPAEEQKDSVSGFDKEELSEDSIPTYHENEPEEELADWNKSESESTYTEYDPFFDPEASSIESEEEPFEEEEPEDEKPKKKPFRSLFASRKKSEHSGFPGKFNKKLLICIAAGAVCAVAVFFLVYALLNAEKPVKEEPVAEVTEPAAVIVTENTAVTEVRHLSFGRLSVSEKEGLLSVNEFSQILDNLYENGYVLVDVYSIAASDENGNFTLSDHVEVPEGKKPLLISQRDVPDPASFDPGTFADGLMIGDDGELRSAYTDADGNTAMGDLDVVPILESFLREHSDFSFAGARGIAALTGYDGLIGHTQTAPEEVIQKMKERGWRFASNGYRGISYGSEQTLIEEDTTAWKENVESRTGETDLLILPRKTDIASWAPYQQDNPKYALLSGLGFKYYFIHTPDTPDFLQVEKGYVREAILEIDTYADYQEALDSGAVS